MIRPSNIRTGESANDTEIRGLSLRRNKGGTYSWMLRYRSRSGAVRRPKIGEYPALQLGDARKIAREMLAHIALGRDPMAEWHKERANPTINELCDEYYERHGRRLKSAESVRTAIKLHIRPHLGKVKVGDLDHSLVQKMHAAISRTVPMQANRVVSILSSMMALAEKWGYRERNTNPCRGIDRNRENKRHRYMRPEEATAVAAELQKETPLMQATIRLLMLTGARRGEFAGRTLQREGKLVLLGDHKTGHGKFIRLPQSAIELIENEGLDGVRLPRPSSVTHAWVNLCKRAGVKDLKLHDLRHTFASAGLSGGVPIGVVGQLLGHKSASTTARYAHLIDDEGDRAVNLAATEVERMLAGE